VTSDFVKSVLRVIVVVVNNLTVKCVVEETLCAERYSCGSNNFKTIVAERISVWRMQCGWVTHSLAWSSLGASHSGI
jgi:hypothetical protein